MTDQWPIDPELPPTDRAIVDDITGLLARYETWLAARQHFSELDGAPNGPTANERQYSDDAAVELLHAAAIALRGVRHRDLLMVEKLREVNRGVSEMVAALRSERLKLSLQSLCSSELRSQLRSMTADRDLLAELLTAMVENETSACSYDHHGDCREHGSSDDEHGCIVRAARSALHL